MEKYGDEHEINFLAFRYFLINKKKADEVYEKRKEVFHSVHDSAWNFAKNLNRKIHLQVDVNFELSEHYALRDRDCDADFDGSHHIIYHKWKFETEIRKDKQLDWTIVDIDDFLKNKNVKDDDDDDTI